MDFFLLELSFRFLLAKMSWRSLIDIHTWVLLLMNYDATAPILSESAGRAIGGIINKFKSLKGM